MDDTQKMFQIIINGQSTFRQEVLSKFDKINKRFNAMDKKIDKVEENLTERLDKIGK